MMVGTIVKWYEPGLSAECPEGLEECQDGICIGIVTSMTNNGKPDICVKWWQLCPKHQQIDPDGTGPYQLDNLWEIGQL